MKTNITKYIDVCDAEIQRDFFSSLAASQNKVCLVFSFHIVCYVLKPVILHSIYLNASDKKKEKTLKKLMISLTILGKNKERKVF